MSRYLAKNLPSKQKNWTVATQKRLAMTTSMVNSLKSLKMLGITAYVESLIHKLRLQELDMAKRVRWMMVAYNASGMLFTCCYVYCTFSYNYSKCAWYIFSHCDVCAIRPCSTFQRLHTQHRDCLHNYSASRNDHAPCKYDHDDCTTSNRLTSCF